MALKVAMSQLDSSIPSVDTCGAANAIQRLSGYRPETPEVMTLRASSSPNMG